MMQLQNTLHAIIVSFVCLTGTAYALPFSVVPNAPLPSSIILNQTIAPTASYIIKNNTNKNPPYNFVKWLPPNTTIAANGTTCLPTDGFKLAPGESCVLNLTVNGTISRVDPIETNHLMICMSDKVTCAGPTPDNSLNVISMPNWINNLNAFGYEVVQGNAYLMTNSECPLYVSIFDSCFGQNPAAPYIIPQVPIEQSYVDPYYAVPLETPGPQGMTDIVYRLGDNDALVTIISFPPEAAYLGYQSYVFTSETSNYVNIPPPRTRTVSPDPSRYDVLGSIGNDVNSLIVQNQYGAAPWGGTVIMYITTSNQVLANDLMQRAMAAGINPKSIFVEQVGSNVITGNGQFADDMLTLMRYAMPENADASNAWKNQLANNVLIYKVTKQKLAVARYGANQYTPHGINTIELSLSTAQQQLVALLQTYLSAAQSPTVSSNEPLVATTTVNSAGVPFSGLVGASCIQYGTNCEADNQDTSTYAFLTLQTLGLEETAFIVGANHSVAELNNNRYVSVDIYDAANSSGVASTSQTNPTAVGFDSGNLTGSATAVLNALGIPIPGGDTALIQNIDKLYLTFIARDCANPTVAAASAYCINLMGTTLIPLAHPISVTERSYVLPGTTTGANVDDMVYPIVVAATHDFPS